MAIGLSPCPFSKDMTVVAAQTTEAEPRRRWTTQLTAVSLARFAPFRDRPVRRPCHAPPGRRRSLACSTLCRVGGDLPDPSLVVSDHRQGAFGPNALAESLVADAALC